MSMDKGEIIIYQMPDGNSNLDVRLEGELEEISTCAKIAQVQYEQLKSTVKLLRTLLIAESRATEKDIMVKLVVNLINKNN